MTEEENTVLTLAQKVERLPLKPVKSVSYQLEVNEEFCVICGSPRLDSDPTGVTCNKLQCLAKLGKKYQAATEEAKTAESEIEDVKNILLELAENLGLKDNELPTDIKRICERIGAIIDETTKTIEETEKNSENAKAGLTEIAKKLGLKPEELPDSIFETCHMIDDGVKKIRENLKSVIEDTLSVDLSGLSDDNLPTLLGVISRELEAIKKAVEKKEQKAD